MSEEDFCDLFESRFPRRVVRSDRHRVSLRGGHSVESTSSGTFRVRLKGLTRPPFAAGSEGQSSTRGVAIRR